MPTLQRMAEIAARYATAMADAMLAACAVRAARTGEPLAVPSRAKAPGALRRGPAARAVGRGERVDWERMVRRNSDTGRNHC